MILGRGKLLVYDTLTELQRSVDASCRVRVEGDIEHLGAALRGRGARVDAVGREEVRVSGLDDVGSAVFELAESSRTVVREITPSRNSLEDIYLKAVRATEGRAHESAAEEPLAGGDS